MRRVEPYSGTGKAIGPRRGVATVPVRPEGIGSHRIDRDEQNVWPNDGFFATRLAAAASHEQHANCGAGDAGFSQGFCGLDGVAGLSSILLDNLPGLTIIQLS